MAEATKVYEKRPHHVQVREVEGVTLELSLQEAITLRAILGRIGGPYSESPRGWVEGIKGALTRVGVPHVLLQPGTHLLESQRAIYFTTGSDASVEKTVDQWRENSRKQVE